MKIYFAACAACFILLPPPIIFPARAAAAGELPLADTIKSSGLSPEQAAREMTLPPGFKATLFAGEPDVKQPIAFAIDDRGRLWVAEAYTYPIRAKEGEGKDRILVFEDTDGDGKFNKRTVVIENLNLVSGIEVGFGGVYVGAAPQLLFFPIENWDEPKAGKPQILLDGWGWQDTHETLNSLTWGPDGWLYGCHGVFTHSNVGKPGAPDTERTRLNAGVWRYHPTRHIFELFAEGTSNPWGIDFDERGQCFIEACVIPHLFHMIQGGRYQRQAGSHFNPYTYDDIKTIGDHVHWAGNQWNQADISKSAQLGGGHAHAGLMIYQGDNWPAEYRGKIFMNNIHGARINMDIPERAGSGFVGRHGADLINFNDKWSQVVNLQSGPDGAVYLIDWYDKNQCHSDNSNSHDRSNGRIFKISFGEKKSTPINLQKLSSDDLVKLIVGKNHWQARHAQRVLQERSIDFWREAAKIETKIQNPLSSTTPENPEFTALQKRFGIFSATGALREIFRKSNDASAQLRAFWALNTLPGGYNEIFCGSQRPERDEFVTAWMIQLAVEDRKGSREALKEFARLAREDKSPVVRLYLASAMQRLPVEDRWEVVEALCSHAEDANDHNLPLMVWYAAEPLATRDVERALLLAENAKLPNILNFMVRRAAALNTPEAFAAITKSLLRVSSQLGGTSYTSPASNEKSGRRGTPPSETKSQRTLDILNGLTTALKGQRNVPMPRGWDEVEKKLGESSNAEVRSLVQSLSLTFGSSRALVSLKQTLMDKSADAAPRKTALDSLLATKDSELPELLQKLLADANMQGSALRSLAAFDDPKTPDAILKIYSSLTAAHKRDALNTLASRTAYAKPLLAAVDAKQISSKELTADLIRQLHNLKNADVDALLTKVWGVARDSTADKQKEIGRYKKIYQLGGSQPGDALRGRIAYTRICAQCHTLFGVGGKVGPDITGSNRGDLDYILQNIVDPNAIMPNDYRASTIEMKDDRILTGIVKEQNEKTLTVATANETLTLARDEIATIKESQLSMMPEGLIANLTDQEVRDLIYYLRQPAQAQLLATPETVGLFFNGKDLVNWDGDTSLWKVENGEIVGKTVTGLKHNEFLKSQLVLGDFRLVCKVKLTPNTANSGIQFRSEPFGEYEMRGCQADIGAGWWGKLYEENGRALLAKPDGDAFVKTNDWNTYEILAVGSKVRTAINGNLCTDLDDEKIARRGITALQVHSGGQTEVRFKDFQLELNPKFELKTGK